MPARIPNPEQQKAIERGEEPLLVIAGPGTGKTTVVIGRMVHLLNSVPGLQPDHILALTYTRKAAEEMKARVSEALQNPPVTPHVYTFHALCERILRENRAEHSLLDEVDVWIFLRRRMEQLGLKYYQKLAEPGAFLHDLNSFFSRCQDELIEPADFESFVERAAADFKERGPQLDPAQQKVEFDEIEKQREVAQVFRKSRELIEAAGCSSLGSLMSETIRLFDANPDVLRHYQQKFRYVLVDEFQDTNYAQIELLRRLVVSPFNILAVGDDDQAIYRFRGASHGAFDMFASVFPRHHTVFLFRNHRSSKRILRCSDVVIKKNEHQLKKPALKTENDEGDQVILIESLDERSEAAWVRNEVQRLVARGCAYGEIAVLYRAHHHRDALVAGLRRARIPFAIRGLSLLGTVILRDLLAYLRLINSPHDNISLTRVLIMPHWRFPECLGLEVRQQAGRDRCSLYDALEAITMASPESAVAETGWSELKQLLGDLRQASYSMPVAELLDLLISRLGLTFLEGDDDLVYVNAFREFLTKWQEKSESGQLREFFEYFNFFVEAGGRIETPELPRLANAVQMMTVHAAKGLEFRIVFVLGLSPYRFPHRAQKALIEFPEELHHGPPPPVNLHTQEERRLFFVAMTRAKERLYVSSVAKRGGKKSVFVDDLLSEPAVRAQDIVTVAAPEAGEEAPYAPSIKAARPGTRLSTTDQGVQPGLFADPADSGCVHPRLQEWSSEPAPGDPTSDGKVRLSATAVEEYLDCPLKFKFNHVLKIPTGPQAALTFGNVMHKCIRTYFELAKTGMPQFGDIERVFLASWKSAGFEDAYQEETYKQAGLEQLRQFVVQQNRKPPIKDVSLEAHFSLDGGEFILEGRIDQVNPMAPALPGSEASRARGAAVEVIDYKTGRPKSQKDADKSLQLSVYALAAQRQLNLEPVRLTFHFLTNGEAVSTVRTPQDLDQALKQISSVAENIREGAFGPVKGWACKWCEFVPICPEHEDEG